MSETLKQLNLPGVPRAKQGREVAPEWAWTQASVWSERMLATLVRGIEGGKWYSLMDKVWKKDNLDNALKAVARNAGAAGTDGVSVEKYLKTRPQRLMHLQERLRAGTYTPQPVKRVWIPKLGSKEKRPLGIPTVEDRVVQTAVRSVIEPIFENLFAEHSYGFRPRRGAKDALREVDARLKSGMEWVVDVDLKGYFDSIAQAEMMERVAEHIADGALMELLERFLKQGVMESGKGWQPTEMGTPQGAVISPLLANLYLNALDHMMAEAGKIMVRYADDFVILCGSQAEAEETLKQLRGWVEEAGLTLHPTKTRIVNTKQPGGFDFLGYHFESGYRKPRKKSMDKLRETIREKTGRTRSGKLEEIIQDINRTLVGWYEYFKHSWRYVFEPIDGWVRGRLRSLLRKRHKGHGRGRGRDHQRWPNAYFANLGLISLALARSKARQSPT